MLEPGELPALAWAFALFFCLLGGYYVLRPLRESVAAVWRADLRWLYTGTFAAMLVAVPVYSWLVARFQRRVFIALVLELFAAQLVLFWLAFTRLEGEGRRLADAAFFVWLSVFNLWVVAIFWSYLVDLFRSDQARRLFGPIAAGGTLGGVAGSAATLWLAGRLAPESLLWIPFGLLQVALVCVVRLAAVGDFRRLAGEGERERAPERVGGGVLSGLVLVARSRYLLAIALFLFLSTLCGTFVYQQQSWLVGQSIPDRAEQAQLFARMNLWAQSMILFLQAFAAARLVKRFGVGLALALLPLCYLVGFSLLGMVTLVAVVAALDVLRRAVGYGFTSPAREVLFSVVGREAVYKSKGFIDTAVWRGGDLVSAWIFDGLRAGLGLSLGAIAFAALPVALGWVLLARVLGFAHARLERDRTGDPACA